MFRAMARAHHFLVHSRFGSGYTVNAGNRDICGTHGWFCVCRYWHLPLPLASEGDIGLKLHTLGTICTYPRYILRHGMCVVINRLDLTHSREKGMRGKSGENITFTDFNLKLEFCCDSEDEGARQGVWDEAPR
jgi:hypothetical protein